MLNYISDYSNENALHSPIYSNGSVLHSSDLAVKVIEVFKTLSLIIEMFY